KLINEGVDFRITLSLSPSLVEMFNDYLLRERYKRYVERLIELSEKEAYRTKGDIHFEPIVKMYNQRFRRIKYLFEDVHKRDLTSAFKALQDTGRIEIITSTATHAFLPNLLIYPQAVRAQIKIAKEHFKKNFNRSPKGIWLPECGYAPGIDQYIREEDIKFFFLDTHGVIYGRPLPQYGVYAPVFCPSGVIAFGRDVETSRQVWSSTEGYPGDIHYRDFYRDIGFDLDHEYIKPYINPDGMRTYTGLKYYRITGKADNKKPYDIVKAKKKAAEHASNFIFNRGLQVDFLSDTLRLNSINFFPVIVATYDAELFGHWWFEGIDWLDFILRETQKKNVNFKTITPSEYIKLFPSQYECLQTCQPSMSSWGHRGYNEVWLNSSNNYIYRHLHKMTNRMIYLADRFPEANGITRRALNQAARELLLSQHSDWAFMINAGDAIEYAKKRFTEHTARFNSLYKSIISKNIPKRWLVEIEDKDRIFADIDYRVYQSKEQRAKG
ncbi:MAG TPA: 1,4-alpha-glucan branching protein domain-containing protein, partial [Thermodesulfovibrionales bacterium]|nr:1,4-alpha-glucan branching protein domain-containing protein [Thermodesulfovibrionales bacterium]